MAFDPLHPGRAPSGIGCDATENDNNPQTFALVHQPYAQWPPRQWQFLQSCPSPGVGLSFPMPAPGSQSAARSASEWRTKHGAFVLPRQPPGVGAMSANSSLAYHPAQNDAVPAPNHFGSSAPMSYSAPPPMELAQPLPAWNHGLASIAPHQSSTPAAFAFPSMPIQLESPAVTMASTMLRTECNAPARHLGTPPSFLSGQTWTATLGPETPIEVAPYSPGPLQIAPWQPQFGGQVIPSPMETTSCFSVFTQKHDSTSPLPVVVSRDDLGSPVSISSKTTHVPKKRRVEHSSDQVYKIRELPKRRTQDDNDVFRQSRRILRWKKRPNPSPEDAVNRILWPCPRHQSSKKKCDCWAETVKSVSSTTLQMVLDVLDIRLFRNQPCVGHPLATRRTESPELEDIPGSAGASTVVLLSQDSCFKHSGIEDFEHGLVVGVVMFEPERGDKTAHEWYDDAGQKHLLQMPHYCIASVADTWVEIQRYIEAAIPQYLDYIIHTSSQEVTKAMLQRARAFSKNSEFKMVKTALDVLAVCRMIEFDWRIVNPDAIGMEPITEKPWYGIVPPTPVMDPILDQIIIRKYLEPMRKELLAELKRKLTQKAPQNISEIILTGFILSTNLQLLLKHSRANAVRHHAARRYNSLDRAKEYIKGHNILMVYIHIILYGSSSSSRSKRCGRLAGLQVPTSNQWSEDETSFFAYIQSLLDSIETDLGAMRANSMYETDLHWSHDIFSRQWTPHSLAIVEAK